jgi:predicted nucleic acid-binding protein
MLSKPVEAKKIYLDSNVWFSYLLKKDANKDGNISIELNKAHLIIDKIISDIKIIALTSHLVIIEIISIIRKKVVTKMKIHGNKDIDDKQSKIHLKNTVDELTRQFIDYITKWEGSGKLQIVKVDESLSSILKKEQKILKKNFGEIKKTTHCFVCKSEYHEYTYRGIDHYDIQHAIIAEYAKADQFITFDRGYEYIKEEFPSLDVQILDPS